MTYFDIELQTNLLPHHTFQSSILNPHSTFLNQPTKTPNKPSHPNPKSQSPKPHQTNITMSRSMGRWAFRMEWTYGPLSRYPGLQPRFHPYTRRPLSQTTRSQLPRKDSQDRNSINTEATEYTKSGTDDQAAQQEEAAFDPSKTSPEEQKAKAGEGNEVPILLQLLPVFS